LASRTVIRLRDRSMPSAQRRRAGGAAAIVLRPPDLAAGDELDRRIENHGSRRVSIVERGSVDERLEGRTGLALGLGGAVELRLGEGEAADHGKNTAGVRIHRDQRAGTFGTCRSSQNLLTVLFDIDVHNVAGIQDVSQQT
jgi:hypothetical protein